MRVTPLAEQLRSMLADDDDYVRLFTSIFPGRTVDQVDEAVAGCVADVLGERPVGAVFVEMSVGAVFGLRLSSGSVVVVKCHRPEVAKAQLVATCSVQRRRWSEGFPAPEPLAGPLPLAGTRATIERCVPGQPADAHDPAIRRAMAALLARVHDSETPAADREALPREAPPSEGLYRPPHNALFDFSRETAVTRAIDEQARRARCLLDGVVGHDVVTHADWSVKNLGFDGSSVIAIYDWDSLRVADEAVAVGLAAASFTATWLLPVDKAPTRDELLAFVGDYEAARGRQFTASRRAVVLAAAVYSQCYTARCESCHTSEDADDTGTFRRALSTYGDELLAQARAS